MDLIIAHPELIHHVVDLLNAIKQSCPARLTILPLYTYTFAFSFNAHMLFPLFVQFNALELPGKSLAAPCDKC